MFELSDFLMRIRFGFYRYFFNSSYFYYMGRSAYLGGIVDEVIGETGDQVSDLHSY